MWHFDIHDDIYSADMCRRIFVVSHDKKVPTARGTRIITTYTLGEEWHTPNSEGEVKNFGHYTFMTAQDAGMALAELAIRFNSREQYVLMRAAEVYATVITDAYKSTAKQMEQEAKRLETEAKRKKPNSPKLDTYVYIFSFDERFCKIGISKNVAARRKTKRSDTGREIPLWAYSEALPYDIAKKKEDICHAHFKTFRALGEFFNISFDEACVFLQSQVAKPLTICREEFK